MARLQASIVTVAHQERPEYLDRLSMLRNQVFVLDHMYVSLFSTLGWILRLAVTHGACWRGFTRRCFCWRCLQCQQSRFHLAAGGRESGTGARSAS